ncbi:hypothetical protein CEE36_00945 [candidate division TA06 bacterium B3_TA06]|uniref:Secretion system C-terminal sorting domain-containing protein n=1 Tax=candidate division TA06 bacterium B3_TA06 TaxID=2012487 RepID=A0A532VAZ0_UNCT6|nr:MAG: hypothetical protein CEE36_00945 [candidate division TA06 bacterium B3_TA06]
MKRFWCVIILTVLAALFQTASAGWTRTYGGDGHDYGHCAQPTPDGGYIITVSTPSFNLLKTDSLGHTLWTKLYPNGHARCVQTTSDGCYIFTGSMTSSVGYVMWLLKTNADGDSLWSRVYDSDWRLHSGAWVEETDDGGYITVGNTIRSMNGIWLRKTNQVGEELWNQMYGDSYEEFEGVKEASCVKQTSDGGYIVTACIPPSFSPPPRVRGAIWLLKTDSQGDSVWAKTYGGESEEDTVDIAAPGSVIQTPDGGYVVGGTRQLNNSSAVWLLKTDAQGDTLWTRTYGDGAEVCEWLDVTSEGGYILAGWTTSFGAGGADFWLIKTDENGDTIWTRTYGGTRFERCHHVRQTPDGGYILIGETDSYGAGLNDAWLIKTDSLGYIDVKEESHTQVNGNWAVITSIGPQIVLRYENRSDGFHASIFDATGRKVDELHAAGASGMITWGQGYSPGVYFVRDMGESRVTKKAVLVR